MSPFTQSKLSFVHNGDIVFVSTYFRTRHRRNKKKGDQANISFFAFTATPKPKTLELFGTTRNGQKEAFDLYSMEQAIKEGFILDVLKNYMSWKRYYKLIKRTEIADKEYEKKKTKLSLKECVTKYMQMMS